MSTKPCGILKIHLRVFFAFFSFLIISNSVKAEFFVVSSNFSMDTGLILPIEKRTNLCEVIITGNIDEKTYTDFYDFLIFPVNVNEPFCSRDTASTIEGSEAIHSVLLASSIGGEVEYAVKIIRLLQKFNIPTRVTQYPAQQIGNRDACLSACSLIFAGSPYRHYVTTKSPLDDLLIDKFRFPQKFTNLGIHKPKFTSGNYDRVQRERELDNIKYDLIDLLQRVGVSPEFVIRTFETPNKDVFFPSLHQLLLWNVVTHITPVEPQTREFDWYE